MIRGMSFKIQKAIDGTFNNNQFDITPGYQDTSNENIANIPHGSSFLSPNVEIVGGRLSTKSIGSVHEK